MILNLLFLIPLFVIGIICAYTDFKYGKIKNRWIVLGFVWVIILYTSLVLFNYFYLHQPENFKFLKEMIINGLFTLVTGYLLWNFKLLAAGDSKLLALYAFLIPPEFYSKAYFLHFPSLTLLINIFIPLLLFLVIQALFFALRSGVEKMKNVKEKRLFNEEQIKLLKSQVSKIFRMYIIFIFIFVILQLVNNQVFKLFGGFIKTSSPVYLFIFLFVIYRSLFSFISKKKVVSLAMAAAGVIYGIYLIVNNQTNLLLNILKVSFVFMVLVGLANRFLDFYIERKETLKVKIKDLKEGMFLSMKDLDNELKSKLSLTGLVGLNKEQVDILQSSFSKEPDKEIKIYKTFALAPFILLGAVISILTKDSFMALLAKALHFLF